MKLEKQVSSIEHSKKLKKLLNLGQWKNIDFNFYWMKTETSENYFLTSNANVGGYTYPVDSMPAFTSAELGVMLPQTINYKTQKASLRISLFNSWTIQYIRHSSGIPVFMAESLNEAEARSTMLIRILEENIITSEEVNMALAKNSV